MSYRRYSNRALKAMTTANGCTEAEALTAAQKLADMHFKLKTTVWENAVRDSAAAEKANRDARQEATLAWVERELLGDGSPEQRGRRLLEEAAEAMQSVGGTLEDAMKVIEHVFSRPAGQPAQEIGGVMITLMGFAAATGNSVYDCELAEFNRIHSYPPGHFHARQREKLAAGL